MLNDGAWELHVQRPFRGELHPFRVVLSAKPEIAPVVYGPPGLLERRQEPTEGHLCLVDSEQNWWRPWYAAVTLIRQLDRLLAATEQGEDAVVAGEAPVAEPLTGHLSFRDDLTILVPEKMLESKLDDRAGSFQLQRVNRHLHVVTRLYSPDQVIIAEAARGVRELTQDEAPIGGWVELEQSPKPSELRESLERASLRAYENRRTRAGKRDANQRQRSRQTHRSRIVGVTFFEEGSGNRRRRRTWVFAETSGGRPGQPLWVADKPIRALSIGEGEMTKRRTELVGLDEARVIVVGAEIRGFIDRGGTRQSRRGAYRHIRRRFL